MSDRRQSHEFLQVAERLDRAERAAGGVEPEEAVARLQQLAEALPAAAPRRRLVHRSILTIGLAVLPLVLWGFGFAPFTLLLLYWCEGWLVAAANLYRILFAAADAEGPRGSVALRYVLLFATPWAAAGAVFWMLYAPDPVIRALLTGGHWRELAGYFVAQHLGWPLAAAAAMLGVEAAQATANIDAYLTFGPKTVARYGYGRIFAAITLLGLTPLFLGAASHFPGASSARSDEQGAAALLVLFVSAVRLLNQLGELWLPVWGRGLFRAGAGLAGSLRRAAPPSPK